MLCTNLVKILGCYTNPHLLGHPSSDIKALCVWWTLKDGWHTERHKKTWAFDTLRMRSDCAYITLRLCPFYHCFILLVEVKKMFREKVSRVKRQKEEQINQGRNFYMMLKKETMIAAEICNLTLCCGLRVMLVPDSLIKVAKGQVLVPYLDKVQQYTRHSYTHALQVFGLQASCHHSFGEPINYWDCNSRDH